MFVDHHFDHHPVLLLRQREQLRLRQQLWRLRQPVRLRGRLRLRLLNGDGRGFGSARFICL